MSACSCLPRPEGGVKSPTAELRLTWHVFIGGAVGVLGPGGSTKISLKQL